MLAENFLTHRKYIKVKFSDPRITSEKDHDPPNRENVYVMKCHSIEQVKFYRD